MDSPSWMSPNLKKSITLPFCHGSCSRHGWGFCALMLYPKHVFQSFFAMERWWLLELCSHPLHLLCTLIARSIFWTGNLRRPDTLKSFALILLIRARPENVPSRDHRTWYLSYVLVTRDLNHFWMNCSILSTPWRALYLVKHLFSISGLVDSVSHR